MPSCSAERDSFGTDFDPHMVEKERVQEECGVVAMYYPRASNGDYRAQIWSSLEGIANRGQHGAGLVITGPQFFWFERNLGKLQEALHQEHFPLDSSMSVVGHTRWATQGSGDLENLQPVHRFTRQGALVVAINGNTHNIEALHEAMGTIQLQNGSSDTVQIAETMATLLEQGYPLEEIIEQVLFTIPQVRDSAYSGVIATDDHMYALRDVHGFRPLYWGTTTTGDGEAFVTASETDAIERMGGRVFGDVPPGSILRFGPDGLQQIRQGSYEQQTECTLEHIYFRKEENRIAVRDKEYEQWPTEGDLRYALGHSIGVINRMEVARLQLELQEAGGNTTLRLAVEGVPNSGLPSARGFAEAVHLPTDTFFRRIGTSRAFIGGNSTEVTQKKVLQKLGINAELFADDELLCALVESMSLGDLLSLKKADVLDVLRSRLSGRKMILVDDSIIHGDSMKAVIMALQHLGVEVVMAVSSQPPTKRGCIYGSDLKDERTMLWNRFQGDIGAMASYIGTRHLIYPSREQFAAVISLTQGRVPNISDQPTAEMFPENGQCGECFYDDAEVPRMFQRESMEKVSRRQVFIPLEPVAGD